MKILLGEKTILSKPASGLPGRKQRPQSRKSGQKHASVVNHRLGVCSVQRKQV